MAQRIILVTVQLNITNTEIETITDNDVQTVVSETNYEFGNVGNFHIQSQIYNVETNTHTHE